MYKNKHVVIAMIVAPILAIISYFAVDQMVAEKPHAAKPGASYQLAEKPNCRYNSGMCDLKNGDFEVRLTTLMRDGNSMLLALSSAHLLSGVKVALVTVDEQGEIINSGMSMSDRPQNMQPADETGMSWSINLPQPDSESNRLQLVLSSNEVLYFGETHLAFTTYKTSFDKDFRHDAR